MAPTKKSTFSSQAASAAPFTPRAANGKSIAKWKSMSEADQTTATPTLQPNAEPSMFNIASVKEFKPQNYEAANTVSCTIMASVEWCTDDRIELGKRRGP